MSSTASREGAAWEPPSPDSLQAMLPQFEVTGILGQGGMGAVYRGRQISLDREVAIKVLPEQLADDDEMNFAARFLQEARAMARLDHPSIISVYDFGETSAGQFYFVMEFVDGMDIHQYLRLHEDRIPAESALSITAHVLDALHYAHEMGIVHRDIKPANIMIDRAGRVKVADFGLAKSLTADSDESMPALTMTNVTVGTPDFVAPEALDSDVVPDQRADLYAVGVMLYQMLTGKLPRGQFKSPSEIHADLDARLDELVSKAMQSDPEDRYADAMTMRRDLDTILTQPMERIEAGDHPDDIDAAVPVTTSVRGGRKAAPTAASGRGRTNLVIAGIVVAMTLVGIVAVFFFGDSESESDQSVLDFSHAEERLVDSIVAPSPGTGHFEAPAATTAPEPVIAESREAAPERPEPEFPDRSAPSKPEVGATETPVPMQTEPTVSESEVVATPPAENAEPSPPETADKGDAQATSHPLARVPGFPGRLGGYLDARDTELSSLAGSYEKGLAARIDQAAEAGDLQLVRAFREEQFRVDELRGHLGSSAKEDPLLRQEMEATLADLPGSSPDSLTSLRETWRTERERIEIELGKQLDLSLQNLVKELTRKRSFEQAELVEAFRVALAPEIGEMASPAAGDEGGFISGMLTENDKPSLRDLPRGQVYAFGKEGGGEFVEVDGRGRLVEFADYRDIVRIDRAPHWPHALRANGEFLGHLRPVEDENRDIVDFSLGYFCALFLHEDGSVSVSREHHAQVPANLDLSAVSDVVSVAGNRYHSAFLKSDGEVAFWSSAGLIDFIEPADRLVKLFATSEIIFGRDEKGRFHAIAPSPSHRWVDELNEIPEIETVAIDPSAAHILALDTNGRVHSVNNDTSVPTDLGEVQKIRVGEAMSAAQQADGKWRAWGQQSTYEVNEKIESLPDSVVDVSVSAFGGEHACVLWIED